MYVSKAKMYINAYIYMYIIYILYIHIKRTNMGYV